MKFVLFTLMIFFICPLVASAVDFEHVATVTGVGSNTYQLVAPGPDGHEKFYMLFNALAGRPFDLVAVDPNTGQSVVYPGPISTEPISWAMTKGVDNNLYIGTKNFLRFNTQLGTWTDLGQPFPGETIWNLTTGSDGKIYGGTYNYARLFSYNPQGNQFADLGRLDPTDDYARWIAAKGEYIYIGVGFAQKHLKAYHIPTGTVQELLPTEKQTYGMARVGKYIDGNIYAIVDDQYFRVDGLVLTPVPENELTKYGENNLLSNGRVIFYRREGLQTMDTNGVITFLPFDYAGGPLRIWRIMRLSDANIYGSTAQPAYLFKLRSDNKIKILGNMGGGEAYSSAAIDKKLLIGMYSGNAPILLYDSILPFDGVTNPKSIHFTGESPGWRPYAARYYGGNTAYIGGSGGKGQLPGPLVEVNVNTAQATAYWPYSDLTMRSMTVYDNLLIVGTSIYGNDDTSPTATEAKLFFWNPREHKIVFDIVPIPNTHSINNLSLVNGLIYGITNAHFFVFDPVSKTTIKSVPLNLTGNVLTNSLVQMPDQELWGLTTAGVYHIDPVAQTIQMGDLAPSTINSGMGRSGPSIYYGSGADLYRYTR